jgi:hypothetical protein
MSNWIDVTLDVLASSREEFNKIEAALQQPCEELLVWEAKKGGEDPKEIAADVKAIVSFDPKRKLGCADPAVNGTRRFEKSFNERFTGLVWSHVYFVSRDFPEAIFLAENWNLQAGSASRSVIRAGREIRSTYDGNQQTQGYEWVLPNIFAPYQTEYDLGLEFGSLWDQWISQMQAELADMKAVYTGSKVVEQQASEEGQE